MLAKFSLLFVCIFMSFNSILKATLVPVARCKGSNEGYCAIRKIDVRPSERMVEDDSCIVDRGSNISVSFEYTPNFTSNCVKWSISQVTIFGDFRLKQLDDDACHFTHCPVEANKTNKFEVSLSIPSTLSTKKYSAKVKLMGNDTKENCCFLINIRVRNPIITSTGLPKSTPIPLDFYGSPMTYPNGSALKNFNITPPTWSEFLNRSLMLAKERAEKTTTGKVSFWKRPFYSLWSGKEEENKNNTGNITAVGNDTIASNETSIANETDYGNEPTDSYNETVANLEMNSNNETAPEYEIGPESEATVANETDVNEPEVEASNETMKGNESVEENINNFTNEQSTPVSEETEMPTEEIEIETTSKAKPTTTSTSEVTAKTIASEITTKPVAERITMKAMVIKQPKTDAKSKNVLTLKIWLPNLAENIIQ